MLRNYENKRLLIAMLLTTVVGVSLAALISTYAILLVLGISACFIGIILISTLWRYRQIKQLSGYLRDISNGNYSLDVRDNTEGELSILKNEIYKVTHMLDEHKNLLQADKTHLADAISDISHQLKTPLTSMGVMTDLLDDPDLPNAKRREFIHNINVQLERINWLVTSLLKLSKIDAGAIEFKQESVNVRHLVDNALGPLHVPIDINNQALSVQGDDSTVFTGDYNWTTEALVNVLKNCIEHTPDGGSITISFSETILYTEIVMTDSGRGIPKEELPYIFNRFHKGKHASETSVGIGLAMAHSIITGQGGTIDATSEPGEGTQFSIKFYKQTI